MEDFISKIKDYLAIINENIKDIDEKLIDFATLEVIDRVKLYLRRDDIETLNIERMLAQIINNGLKKSIKEMGTLEPNRAINSISDNGQSISYANVITNYFTTASDNEMFTGFSSVMARYRRVKVVNPQEYEISNS